MADERCVYPEDAESSSGSGAGRSPDRWLDARTAERLLRGESLETVDAAVRDQAERLAKTLEALTAEPVSADDGLRGEEAALAAFRKARADRADDWVSPPARGRHRTGARPADAAPADAGLVRIGAPDDARAVRPRRRRPAHLALAAVLAAGVVGGAAVVAGTGMQGRSGHDDPDPGTSVSAAVTPDRPLISPTAPVPEIAPSPKGSPSGATGSRDTARGDIRTTPGTSSEGFGVRPEGAWNGAASACRDLRDGRNLSSGRAQSLADAAGGPLRVRTYCRGVLAGTGTGTGTQDDPRVAPDDRKDTRDDGDGGDKSGSGDENGQGDEGGHNGGQFMAPGRNHHGPDGGTSETPFASHRATMSPSQEPTPDPSPTYSAL
ncbi:hypothetical protein AB0D34_44545 [Streptomyces sp. NPDC048420]|uniref:hypothetical protein n=1 Tax=Streptomyces sp. NPDC048420 TaxID=3155755 RepID=UPI003413298F